LKKKKQQQRGEEEEEKKLGLLFNFTEYQGRGLQEGQMRRTSAQRKKDPIAQWRGKVEGTLPKRSRGLPAAQIRKGSARGGREKKISDRYLGKKNGLPVFSASQPGRKEKGNKGDEDFMLIASGVEKRN